MAGGHIPSIAKSVFANPSLRELLVEKVVQAVGNECASVCSRSAQPVSLFRRLSLDQSDTFAWRECVGELEKCPILFRLFTHIVSHTDHRNASKRGEKHYPGICMATAVLLKERNQEMTGMQAFLSVLFSCRVEKVCVCVCEGDFQQHS